MKFYSGFYTQLVINRLIIDKHLGSFFIVEIALKFLLEMIIDSLPKASRSDHPITAAWLQGEGACGLQGMRSKSVFAQNRYSNVAVIGLGKGTEFKFLIEMLMCTSCCGSKGCIFDRI